MEWAREVAGWALVGIGLVIFAIVHDYFERRWPFDAAAVRRQHRRRPSGTRHRPNNDSR